MNIYLDSLIDVLHLIMNEDCINLLSHFDNNLDNFEVFFDIINVLGLVCLNEILLSFELLSSFEKNLVEVEVDMHYELGLNGMMNGNWFFFFFFGGWFFYIVVILVIYF